MQKINFCDNWSFSRGLTPEKKETVCLPHDAMITERRGPEAPSGAPGAYFYGDVYTYEKTLDVPKDWADKTVTLEFEGSYMRTTVCVNGQKAAFHGYGYTPFFVVLDDYLKYGEANTVTVEVDNSKQPNSRWYGGSGLYRPVTLYVQPKDHIALEGVRVFTQDLGPAACGCTREYAKVRVLTETVGEGTPKVELLKDGEVVASGEGADILLTVENAKLWSEDKPILYEYKVTFGDDEARGRFGIRTLEWSSKGFFVNGKSVKFRGGCIHHDNGIVGSTAYEEMEYRKVRIMKEQGFNAIRSAHNPCSKALMDAADELGVYILDEAFDMWYTHKTPHDAAEFFEEAGVEDTVSMVRRDVNHPSVIGYSLVNEPSELTSDKGKDYIRECYKAMKAVDSSRPVTTGLNLLLASAAALTTGNIFEAAYNIGDEKEDTTRFDENGNAVGTEQAKTVDGSSAFNAAFQRAGKLMNAMSKNPYTDKVTTGISDLLDMCGYNYAASRYSKEGKLHPDRLIFGSETLPMDIYDNWGHVEREDYNCGDFMWTGWDHLGEVGIGAWSYKDDGMMARRNYPWILSGAGAIDLLGHPGCEMGYAGIVWKQQADPQIFVRPVNFPGMKPSETMWRGSNAIDSWAWKGCEGNEAYVEVYTTAPYVTLKLNGKIMGQAKTKKDIATFKIPYEPGILTAETLVGGVVSGKAERVSARDDLQLTLTPSFKDVREECIAKAGELVFVNIDITDSKGVVESNADTIITVDVEGGELVAFGSAITDTEYRYHTGTFPTWFGRSMAVVRAGDAGSFTVTAKSESGLAGEVEVKVK